MHNQPRGTGRRPASNPTPERPRLQLDGSVLRERLGRANQPPSFPPSPPPTRSADPVVSLSAPAPVASTVDVPARSKMPPAPQAPAPAPDVRPVNNNQPRTKVRLKRSGPSRRRLMVAGAATVAMVIVVTAMGVWWLQARNPAHSLTGEVRNQLTFPVFLPGRGSGLTLDKASESYDRSNGVFRFEGSIGSVGIKINEQAEPSALKSHQAYSDLLLGLHPFGSVSSPYGSMALTRPPELDGSPALVAKEQGILMFIKADQELTKAQWQQLAAHLQVVQPTHSKKH